MQDVPAAATRLIGDGFPELAVAFGDTGGQLATWPQHPGELAEHDWDVGPWDVEQRGDAPYGIQRTRCYGQCTHVRLSDAWYPLRGEHSPGKIETGSAEASCPQQPCVMPG